MLQLNFFCFCFLFGNRGKRPYTQGFAILELFKLLVSVINSVIEQPGAFVLIHDLVKDPLSLFTTFTKHPRQWIRSSKTRNSSRAPESWSTSPESECICNNVELRVKDAIFLQTFACGTSAAPETYWQVCWFACRADAITSRVIPMGLAALGAACVVRWLFACFMGLQFKVLKFYRARKTSPITITMQQRRKFRCCIGDIHSKLPRQS